MYNMLQGCHLVQNIAIEDGAGSLHFFVGGGDEFMVNLGEEC